MLGAEVRRIMLIVVLVLVLITALAYAVALAASPGGAARHVTAPGAPRNGVIVR